MSHLDPGPCVSPPEQRDSSKSSLSSGSAMSPEKTSAYPCVFLSRLMGFKVPLISPSSPYSSSLVRDRGFWGFGVSVFLVVKAVFLLLDFVNPYCSLQTEAGPGPICQTSPLFKQLMRFRLTGKGLKLWDKGIENCSHRDAHAQLEMRRAPYVCSLRHDFTAVTEA